MPLIERIVSFSINHRVWSHVIFWLVLSLIFMNRYDPVEFDRFDLIIMRHIYYVSFTALSSYFLAYFIIPMIIRAVNYYVIVMYFLAGSYVLCVLARMAVIFILEPHIRVPPFGHESVPEIMTDLPKLITHYFVLIFSMAWIFGFIKLIKDQYVTQQRALLLEKEKAQSELRALRSQLNPHFLFNTLNNIYSLSLMNSPITSRSIAYLSDILDHILYRGSEQEVPLSSEILLIQHYLELEKLRYDEHLCVTFKHEIEKDVSIAPLILLSLVENAFKHGAAENIGAKIEIELFYQQGVFRFRVANSFLPDEPQAKEKIGLANITRQLELLYPGRYKFDVFTDADVFIVLLAIQLQVLPGQNIRHENKVSYR